MVDYCKYNIEDFVSDEQFVKWVLHPEPNNALFWSKWLENHPDKNELVQEARFIVHHIHFKAVPNDQRQFNKILDNVLLYQYSKKTQYFSTSNFVVWYRIAAIFIGLLILSLAFYYFPTVQNHEISKSLAIDLIIKENPVGIKSTVVLPDGSTVNLNSDSQLIFPEVVENEYVVELIGEAFFDILPNSERKFTVKTGDLYVTALGTSFNVKAFPADDVVKVALTSGNVLVQKKEDDQVVTSSNLNQGQKIEYVKNSFELIASNFDVEMEIGWKDGKIVFEAASLETFIKEIERWYGVEVVVSGQPGQQWRINGKFEDLSLQLLLESVKFSKNIDYSINGKQVVIFI